MTEEEEEREVWYVVLDRHGKEGNADAVDLLSFKSIRRFRDKVQAKNPRKVAGYDPSDLVVYVNKGAFVKTFGSTN